MVGESGIQVLVRFARLAAEAGTGAAILPLLADALVEHVGADAVAILEIGETGVAMIPSPHLPTELEGLSVDPDTMGAELGTKLLATCNGRFAHVRLHPLVSGGGLFGMVAKLFAASEAPAHLALADGLIDLAAVALANAARLQELARSHADLRISQEALARTEKLRALGQMAAGVSHDLKNILNPLSLHMQLAQRAMERGKPDDAKQSFVEMKQVLVRGVQTIERLRDYSRQSPETKTEDVDLNHLVREAVAIARPRMASRGGATTRICEELGAPQHIRGGGAEILNAIVNLIVNAIDAIPSGGTITLRTGASGSTDAGSWVEVRDDGPGMPPEVERRVFEPFFTTKGDAGTGLGLANVYACVHRHGGTVKLDTAVGKGTAFTLSFPAVPNAPSST